MAYSIVYSGLKSEKASTVIGAEKQSLWDVYSS